MVLNGVWLRKNTVQSAGCLSAPSGSMRLAKRLGERARVCVSWQLDVRTRTLHAPFIRPERLRELVGQLRAAVDVEIGDEDE